MTDRNLHAVLSEEFRGMCGKVSLSEHTTWRIGGPALQITATSGENLGKILSFFQSWNVPWFILGMGSNVLAPSEGTDHVILRLSGDLAGTAFGKEGHRWRVTAGGGARLPSLSGAACMQGASGLQFAVGIPGTVGGAVVMNAGAYGSTISDLLETVTVRLSSGARETLAAEDCGFGYRTSRFGQEAAVIESVDLVLEEGDPDELRREAVEILELRRRKFPLDYPNAGSVFRRPYDGTPPGLLIEQSGLKGFRIGGAGVSTRHANFVVNMGDASSGDVEAVIETVRSRVFEDTGISLREEILYMPRGEES
jgi:UDP-N-acetylmuramate dehydrogenase